MRVRKMKTLGQPAIPSLLLFLLLGHMAILTPMLQRAWIDEFWIVNYGKNVFGETEIHPRATLTWGGAWLAALFHDALPGILGQRWLSWLSTIGMVVAGAWLGRTLRLHRSATLWFLVLLLLSPEVRFEGYAGRVDNLAMMWVFLALGQTHLTLTSSPRNGWWAGAFAVIAVWTWITAVMPLMALAGFAIRHDRRVVWSGLWRAAVGGCLAALGIFLLAPSYASDGFVVLWEQFNWRWDENRPDSSSGPPQWIRHLKSLVLVAGIVVLGAARGLRMGRQRTLVLFDVLLVVVGLWLTVRTHLYHGRIVYWVFLAVAVGLQQWAEPRQAGRKISGTRALQFLAGFALCMGAWQAPAAFFSLRYALRKPPIEQMLETRVNWLRVKPNDRVAVFEREYGPVVALAGATPWMHSLPETPPENTDLVIGLPFGTASLPTTWIEAGFEEVVWPEEIQSTRAFQPLPRTWQRQH